MLEMQARWNDTMIERQGDFDDARDSRRRLKVADVGFYRSDQAWPVGSASLDENLTQRGGFDRIAQQRSGSMSLHVVQRARRHARTRISRAKHRRLRLATGSGQAVRSAILIDRDAPNGRINRIAIGERGLKGFQQHQSYAFAAHITIGRGIEGLATPVGGEESRRRERLRQRGIENQTHAARQCECGIAAAQALTGQMERHQRR